MTIEEKLEHFYDSSVEEAKKRADTELAAHKKALARSLAEHQKTAREESQRELRAEKENARREVNKALSAQQLDIKRSQTARENQWKETLFAGVSKRLDAFMATPAYEDYLLKKIREAVEFAEGKDITISVITSDSGLAERLSRRSGLPLQIQPDDFPGGIRAVIPEKTS